MSAPSVRRLDLVEVPAGSSPAVEDERAWVAHIREGDKAAFERLFRIYGEPLCRYVYAIVRSRAVAEELVQDVFAHLWVRRQEWEVRTSVASYLYVAARNRAMNQRKRGEVADRWMARDIATQTGDTPLDTPDHALERSELHVALADALGRLPERCRETFILRRQHQLSYPEVAATMGVTVKCVERQFTKALKILRRELAGYL